MPSTSPDSHAPALHPALIVAICGGAMFMEMLDGTIILTAFPRMAADFHTRPVELSVGVTAYLLALAALLPASGWIADRFGTRRVFLVAIIGFVVTSVLCAFSQSLDSFTAARALQGASAALMSPVARVSMVRAMRGERLAQAINLCAMMALLGPAIGPPLGGWLATYWDWRWIFFINVPIGLGGWLLARMVLPDYRAAERRGFDRSGFLLNAVAVAAVLYGLEWLSKNDTDRRVGAALVVAGLLAGWFAVRHARREPQGMIDIRPLQVASFRSSLVGGVLFRLSMFGPMFLLPLLLQLGLGLDAFTAGLYIMLGAGADVLTKLLVLPTLRWLGFRRLLMLSSLLNGGFTLLLALVDAQTPGLLLAVLLTAGGFIRSFHMSSTNMIVYADLPPERISGGSTLVVLGHQVSMALAVALAALLVDVAAQWSGDALGGAVTLRDFRPALLLCGLTAFLAVRWYGRLHPDSGAELSGRR